MCYLPKKKLTLDKYEIVMYPYISIPSNMAYPEEGDAIQFGADFRVSFSRQGEHQKNLMMLQFVFPQEGTVTVGEHQAGAWNLDRSVEKASLLEDCAYGIPSFDLRIGPDREIFAKSEYSTVACCITDMPREIYSLRNSEASDSAHRATPISLRTVFANFVMESGYMKPKLIFRGITWGYEFKQRSASGRGCNEFDVEVINPTYIKDFSPFATVLASKGLKKESDYKYCG